MRKPSIPVVLALTAFSSAAGGYLLSDMQHDKRAFDASRENYTDRGRICIEAAAMIRNGNTEQAREHLEGAAIGAIRGVPMGSPFADLLPKSQVLLVSAKRYETAFPETNFQIERLARDVPADHPNVSSEVKAATSSTL